MDNLTDLEKECLDAFQTVSVARFAGIEVTYMELINIMNELRWKLQRKEKGE